ncbi:MAG: triose-phosphate isomerase [Fimbriimonadaceae bacterium]
MRTKLVAGNWKMNMTSAEGVALVEGFIEQAEIRYDIDVVVCPPYLSIPKVREITKKSSVKLGAQDVFWMQEGAFTGNAPNNSLNSAWITALLGIARLVVALARWKFRSPLWVTSANQKRRSISKSNRFCITALTNPLCW